jgi:hypothetical protein
MDGRGKRLGRRFRLPCREPGQASEHDLGLLETDILNLAAVRRVPETRVGLLTGAMVEDPGVLEHYELVKLAPEPSDSVASTFTGRS